jgi:lipoprotein-anchoring transpeptidase ErfK/SrfK
MNRFTAQFDRPAFRRVRHSPRTVAAGAGSISVGVAFSLVVALAFAAGAVTSSSALVAPIAPGPSAPPSTQPTSLSVVAQARGKSVAIFATASSERAYEVLQNPTASGDPLVFLVSGTALDSTWLHVFLPSRPNQSQGWIPTSAVTLSADGFRIDVDLSTHLMTVLNDGHAVMSLKVGEGRSALPTPTGTFFIVDLLKQPNPAGEYGPYAFGLSAFSNVLQSFGGGPGEIGIHGTDEPDSVGASLSHGCIRVSNATIATLAKLLPLGTPVVIDG